MMKRYLVPIVLVIILFPISCKEKGKPAQEESAVTQFTNQITDAEKAGGVMTPEILWKFRRLGSIVLSPDGSTILFTVTDIDLKSEVRRTNIFSIPSSGGEPNQLTTDGGSDPQWINDGRSIAFVADGKLMTMNADGSEKETVEGLKDFEYFSISPSGKDIYFTRRVKLDQTANERYNLPKAKVRIIDDLMYRHWNYWSDYSYSHILVASFNGKNVSGEKDIMKGQRFESPLSPFFDAGEISWSPDGKYIQIFSCTRYPQVKR
jgi:Tol biopolymer transport system component